LTDSKLTERVDPRRLLVAWLKVSLQSFGGGTATLALIRREFVDREGWVTEERFLRDWSLCQLAPGINLIALSILLGRRLAGWFGVLISLAGLLLPSFAITVILTALYARYDHTALVGRAMHGVIPAVAAIGLATAFSMAKPIFAGLREVGDLKFGFYVLLFGLGIACSWIWRIPTIGVALGSGAVGSVFNILWERRTS
jgi:chromate transporter